MDTGAGSWREAQADCPSEPSAWDGRPAVGDTCQQPLEANYTCLALYMVTVPNFRMLTLWWYKTDKHSAETPLPILSLNPG